jgi:hypothetical protein
MKPCIVLLVLLFIIGSCSTKSVYKKQSDLHIIYGSGGGFTGATVQYEIVGKGDILKISIPGDTIKLGKITNQQKSYLRTLINSDSLSRISYNHYANMTSFLYIKVKDRSLYSFQWNNDRTYLPQPLFQLDSFLNSLVKSKVK